MYSNQMSIPTFFDNGSAYSLIRKSLALKITESFEPIQALSLLCMNGESCAPIGCINLNLKLGHKWFHHKFLVMERLPLPVFIGRDLIKSSNIILHEGSDSFWFPESPNCKYPLNNVKGKFCFYLNKSSLITDDQEQKLIEDMVNQLLNKYPQVLGPHRNEGWN